MGIVKTYRFPKFPDHKGHVIYSYVPEPMNQYSMKLVIVKTYRFADPDQKGHVIYSYVPEPMNQYPMKLVRIKIYGRGKVGSQLNDELEIQCGILSKLFQNCSI